MSAQDFQMASNVSETSEDTLDLLSNDELDAILASLDFDLDTEEDRKVKCSFCEKVCASLCFNVGLIVICSSVTAL